MSIVALISKIDSFIWGPPLMIFLAGTGLYLTARMRLEDYFKRMREANRL